MTRAFKHRYGKLVEARRHRSFIHSIAIWCGPLILTTRTFQFIWIFLELFCIFDATFFASRDLNANNSNLTVSMSRTFCFNEFETCVEYILYVKCDFSIKNKRTERIIQFYFECDKEPLESGCFSYSIKSDALDDFFCEFIVILF